MRNRLLVLLLAIGVIAALVAGSVFADGLVQDPKRRVSAYTMVKDGSANPAIKTDQGDGWGKAISTTEERGAQLVALSDISTNDRILGWSLMTLDEVSGATAALYDIEGATTAANAEAIMTAANLYAEAEVGEVVAGADPYVLTWFPYPMQYDYRLLIVVGPQNAIVTIYYEDVSAY